MAIQRRYSGAELAPELALDTALETSFRLLDLPPEIRSEIYVHFLSSPLAIPDRTREERVQRNGHSTAQAHYSVERCTKFSLSPPQFSAIPLLLCNRLLHDEFKATIATFMNQNKLRYELDCEINGERYLYPDWTLLPVKASHIPCLYVSFRFCGTADSTTELGYNTGMSHPAMICSLLYILFRFLQRGPHMRSQVKDRNIAIGTLVLDVLTPSLSPHRVFKPVGTIGRDKIIPEEGTTIIHPGTFVGIIHRYLDRMYFRHFDLPQVLIILRSVATVYLLHDGEEKHFWDLQFPAALSDTDSSSEDG